MRELRTIAEAIDGILRGNQLQVLDLLMQQYRAKIMAIEDNSWTAAKWLQLLPIGSIHQEATSDDYEMARRMEQKEIAAAERRRKVLGGPR